MKIGYARISTKSQDLSLQLDALKAAGCGEVFTDRASGTKIDRPGLLSAFSCVQAGDSFVVWKLDRLGRRLMDLVRFVEDLEGRGVKFESLTDKIETSTPEGRFFFHVQAARAEMERELIAQRTQVGLDAAKRSGRTGGRPLRMTESKKGAAQELLANGIKHQEVAKSLGISLATLYRHIPANVPAAPFPS